MVPGGWGQNPPTTAQIDAMAGWAERNLGAANGIVDDGMAGTDKLNAALDQQDVRGTKVACDDTTQPITIRLPAVLPTPDPDMTNGFQSLIDAGNNLAQKCAALTDPPTPEALHSLSDAMGNFSAALRFTGNIMKRDGSILSAAGR